MTKLTDPSLIRKYFYEVVVSALVAAVVFLFWTIIDLYSYINNELTSIKIENIRALDRNTAAFEKNTSVLNSLNNKQ